MTFETILKGRRAITGLVLIQSWTVTIQILGFNHSVFSLKFGYFYVN